MTADSIVSLDGVTKSYAKHVAVRELDLTVRQGAVYGLLGPNGAGKTTTIRMIMNIILPDCGSVELFGQRRSGRAVAHRIGYLPEERGLYRKMKVIELLAFLAQIKGIRRASARRAAREWLERLGLSAWSDRRVEDLSKGMQQKVQFISTVLHQPDLLVLDEPFAGLDPVNAQTMKDEVVRLSRNGTTILFSTHILEQAERLCDSVCIVARGRKVTDGPVETIKARHGGSHVIVGFEDGGAAAAGLLTDSRLVKRADDHGRYAELELADGVNPHEVLGELVAVGARVDRFEVTKATLNKIFIDLVGAEAATAAASEVRDDE